MYRRIYILRKACYLVAIIINFVIIFSSVAIAERMTVAASIANIRSGPGTKHDILWQVGKYHPIFVMKKSVNWFYFRDFEGDKGWIYETLISSKKTVIVDVETANMRSGSSTSDSIIATVKKGVVFEMLEMKGDWMKVSYKNEITGWMHNSLLWPSNPR